MSDGFTYEASGVSLGANDEAVELIAKRIAEEGATRPEVLGGIGGFAGAFAGAFRHLDDPVLISATDGVGTKLTIAQTMGIHDTVGIDLVAMVADDIVCAGAEPLFLLDYLACGQNLPERTAEIVAGIARGCTMAGMALLGGETAEHPGVMAPDEYDLAAFGVGVVDRSKLLGPEQVREGDVVVGFRSSGLHSNGYSLVRKLILDKDLTLDMPLRGTDISLGEALLTPCRIHTRGVLAAIEAGGVRAAAHITGGGIAGNIVRSLPAGMGARIDKSTWERHPIFSFLQEVGNIAEEEMQKVFNCGLGMAMIVAPDAAGAVMAAAHETGETAMVIGDVRAGAGVVIDG